MVKTLKGIAQVSTLMKTFSVHGNCLQYNKNCQSFGGISNFNELNFC
jgi:hypothetical protein